MRREIRHATDPAKAESECGILTTLINKFEADNPDIHVRLNIVAWPGYPQLSAQIAARDPPDLVTMHQSVISDYSGLGLLEPLDGILAQAGIRTADFTEAGRAGVVKAGHVYAMPWDTIGGLFHINTALMAKAGLMQGGKPVLPRSPEQLLAQARQFKARTGKPYLIQAQVNDPATHVRNLYTYLMAQDAVIFPDAKHVVIDTAKARAIVALFRTIYAENLTTKNQDFSAATQSFVNGDGGIFSVGTWMIGPYDDEAKTRAARFNGITPSSPTRACGATTQRSSMAMRGSSRATHAAPLKSRRSHGSCGSCRSTISTGRGPATCPRSGQYSTRPGSKSSRTAATSRQWRQPAASFPTSSSASRRSRRRSARNSNQR